MSAHRYWRLLVTSVVSGSYATIGEIEMRETSGGSDATGSGTASASSYHAGYEPGNAFANNGVAYANSWVSQASPTPHWIQYDFGAGQEKNIQEYVIQSASTVQNEVPTGWDFQYSDDGTSWTTIDTRSGITLGLSGTGAYSCVSYSIAGVIADSLGQPCQRKVYAVSRPTDATEPVVLAHGLSDATTGIYELLLTTNDEVTRVVVSEDDDDPLMNDIVDRVIPA